MYTNKYSNSILNKFQAEGFPLPFFITHTYIYLQIALHMLKYVNTFLFNDPGEAINLYM